MSTFIQKNRVNRSRNESIFRVQSCRQKIPLVLQEVALQNEAKRQAKSHRLHLPCIYQTQHLLKKERHLHIHTNKENQYLPLKLNDKKVDHSKNRNRLSILKRHNTDVKEKQEIVQKVYHNFIKKKDLRNNVYMSKIIDKVISDSIEPWSLSRMKQRQCNNLYFYELGGCGEDSLQMIKQKLA